MSPRRNYKKIDADSIIVKNLSSFDFSVKIPSFASGEEHVAKFIIQSTHQEGFESPPDYLAEFYLLEITASSFQLFIQRPVHLFNAPE